MYKLLLTLPSMVCLWQSVEGLPPMGVVVKSSLEPIATALKIDNKLLAKLVDYVLNDQPALFIEEAPLGGHLTESDKRSINKMFHASLTLPVQETTLTLSFPLHGAPTLLDRIITDGRLSTFRELFIDPLVKKQNRLEQEDRLLHSSLIAAVAQEVALLKVKLMIRILKQGNFAERLYALFRLNRVSLIGTEGKKFHARLVEMNKDYFTKEGFIKKPEKNKSSPMQLLLTTLGISTGIKPATIFSHKSNRDFLRVLEYSASGKLEKAAAIIAAHKHNCFPYRYMKQLLHGNDKLC